MEDAHAQLIISILLRNANLSQWHQYPLKAPLEVRRGLHVPEVNTELRTRYAAYRNNMYRVEAAWRQGESFSVTLS